MGVDSECKSDRGKGMLEGLGGGYNGSFDEVYAVI